MPDTPLTGRHILVVEDEYLIASEVKRWLLTAGAIVVGPVPSVDGALDLIADHRPDAAVLDVNLGDRDTAYPIADKLGILGVPYLFATGDLHLADASVYGHRPWIEKPFVESELVRVLTKLIATP
ncbi:CheY chemotaxis protein or a CheY-like REC (receiver) domain [Methylobacterium phyllostachyos]|uniref:CheY chemotaxis protein or a CheY-like REC (Receiver) domain n=1 Tax=Methylobacterium phyllostachyos TaxID=582672 RepID=A0A1H0C6Y4_9HYPH|nr:response regulator [Methylobacterium phyllostachyos]SDN53628.1 CheY chemotaxis protein or a CheY-like REC (receiver) domain [Methylobacterium phyllostachyos]